jgi:hypothetical protein
MKRYVAAAAVLLFSACSSAAGPGAGDVLGQVDKASAVEVEAALRSAAVAEEAYFAQQGTYTTDVAALGVNPGPSVTLTAARADAADFCIQGTHARSPDDPWHISKGGAPARGGC